MILKLKLFKQYGILRTEILKLNKKEPLSFGKKPYNNLS